jgi:hypothetical protein
MIQTNRKTIQTGHAKSPTPSWLAPPRRFTLLFPSSSPPRRARESVTMSQNSARWTRMNRQMIRTAHPLLKFFSQPPKASPQIILTLSPPFPRLAPSPGTMSQNSAPWTRMNRPMIPTGQLPTTRLF